MLSGIIKDLPKEPKLFALVHELKHHWADRPLNGSGPPFMWFVQRERATRKALKVFAAEFYIP